MKEVWVLKEEEVEDSSWLQPSITIRQMHEFLKTNASSKFLMNKQWFWRSRLKKDTTWLSSNFHQVAIRTKFRSQGLKHLPNKTPKTSQEVPSMSNQGVTTQLCIRKMSSNSIKGVCISNTTSKEVSSCQIRENLSNVRVLVALSLTLNL